ncbi:MAG: TonB-dependent receptor plug domain-containing protein [Pseudomarimonas sp.]
MPSCRPMRFRRLSVLLALTVACTQAVAAEEEDLADLLDLLADETELATRNKQNADYVPGIISVLHADEARLLGARSVLDAIAQIPGMEINRDQFGSATVRARSIDFFFNGGNVKVLVDSLPISRETAFQNSAILLMPIEQVERIEVIRGPGSGIHGDFAFMGLINIVTRRDGNALSATAGSGTRRSGVWAFNAGAEDAPVQVAGSLSNWSSDRYDGPFAFANDESRQYLSLDITAGAFSVKAAGLERDFAGFARAGGRPGQPPPPPNALVPIQQDETNRVIQARYQWQVDAEQHRAVWLQYNRSLFDRGVAGFDGSRWEAGGESVQRFGAHLVLAQVQVADQRIDDAFLPQNRDRPRINESRQISALTLQDQFDVSERLQLTGGLRYDDVEDIDQAWTPRAAVLWKLGENHLLKAQYAEGFRSPTYIELYDGGPPPTHTPFERVRTRELAYIFRTADSVFRLTGFTAVVSDTIFPRGTPSFDRGLEIHSRGLEVELTHRFNPMLKVAGTWSTANASDDRTQVISPGQPPQMGGPSLSQPESLGNLALLATFSERWSAGLHWNHVGRRADRGREGFHPGYDSVNLGLEFTPTAVQGLRLSAGWRNLLDDSIVHIVSQPPNNVLLLDYSEPQWSVSASWEF